MSHNTVDATQLEGRRRENWSGMRREWYLLRVDWHLDALVSGRERKLILGSLRESIVAESATVPLSEVLAGLGSPRALATSHAEGSPPRPRWIVGIVAAASALVLYWAVFFSYLLGMLAVTDQLQLGEVHSRFALIDVVAFADTDGVGVGWTGGLAWLLLPLAVVGLVFLIASRLWRSVRSPVRHQDSDPVLP
jgi:hypothetical protein